MFCRFNPVHAVVIEEQTKVDPYFMSNVGNGFLDVHYIVVQI